MSDINPYRMLGRIAQLPYSLMGRYNMRLTANVPDVQQLLYALSTKVNQFDSSLCQKAITLYSEYWNQAQRQQLPQAEIDRLYGQGVEETRYIFQAYPQGYGSYLFLNVDFLAEREAKRLAAKARSRRITMIILGVIAAVILGIVIYNLPYFKEMRSYGEVKKAYGEEYPWRVEYCVDDYVRDFPDGKHLDQVLMMLVSIKQEEDDAVSTLDAAERYIELLPDGPHADECRQIISDIWDAEISKYQSRVQTPTKATEFVVSMLRYMKRENIREIAVVPHPELRLKDYADYSDNVKRLMEFFYSDSEPRLSTLVTIKDKIDDETAGYWARYITDALNKGFGQVLTRSFIEFNTVYDESDLDPNMPRVDASFIVKTQEDEYGCPELWIYTETESNYGVTLNKKQSLVLGIAMDFDVDFILPDTGQQYEFKSSGDPGSAEIKGDPSSAYATMCNRCTQVFAEDLSRQLGLPQGEE